jgi:hypothetical protein
MDRDYFLPAIESSEGARLPSDDVYSFAQQIILNERHIKGIIGKVVPWEACSRNRTAKPWAGTVWGPSISSCDDRSEAARHRHSVIGSHSI